MICAYFALLAVILQILLVFQCFTSNIPQCTMSKCMPTQKEIYCMVCASVRVLIQSLKLVDYFPVQTHKPLNNLHFQPTIVYLIVIVHTYLHCNILFCNNGNSVLVRRRSSQSNCLTLT